MDADYYNDISDRIQDSTKDKYNRIFQSTLIYILAYIVVTYTNIGVSGIVAHLMQYKTRISYFGLLDMPTSPTQWTRWSILFIFFSGPLASLILAFISYRINIAIRDYNTIWKALTLWIAVQGTCLFFSYCITSSFGTGSPYLPFYYGFAVIASWLYIDSALMAPVTIFGIVSLIVFGLSAIVPFLNLCFSRSLAMNYKGKRIFLLQVAVIPWIIGSIFTMLISVPATGAMRDIMINLARSASMAFVLLGILFKMDQITGSIKVHSFDIFKKSPKVLILITLALVLFIQQRWIIELLHFIGIKW